MAKYWLSKEFLDWDLMPESFEYPNSDWQRPYELWGHSENLLMNNCNEFQLVDAITTLKRSIDIRIKTLNTLYYFRKLPIDKKPKGLIEQMALLEIVKPKMVRSLIEIRNLIEHQDKEPPSQVRCAELLEFAWYFLRSTDSICKASVNDFTYTNYVYEEDKKYSYHVNITIFPNKNWSILLTGSVQPNCVSSSKKDGWFCFEGDVSTFGDWFQSKGLKDSQADDYFLDRKKEDYWIESTKTYFSDLQFGRLIDDMFFLCHIKI